MYRDESGFGGVLAAAEDAEPAASVDVVARFLRTRFGAQSVSFLSADLVKRELVRLTDQGQTQSAYSAERVRLEAVTMTRCCAPRSCTGCRASTAASG